MKFKFNKKRVYYAASVLMIAIIIVAGIIYLIRKPESAAAWFNDDWYYRQSVPLTNAGSALTDYQISITLDTTTLITAGKMQSDCDDIRLADALGNILPHWLEKNNFACNSATTKIWTKVNSIPVGSSAIYLYYGNLSATNAQDGNDVFLFYDDFSGTALSSSWTTVANGSAGTYTVTGGYLELSGGGSPTLAIAPSVGTNDYTVDADMNYPVTVGDAGGLISRYTATGNYYHQELDTSSLYLFRFTNFGYASLGSTASTNNIGTWYNVSIKAVSSSLIVSTQPQNVTVSATDATWTTGQPGVYRWNQNTRFDNFRVRKAVSSEPTVGSLGAEEKGLAPIAYWRFDEGYGTTTQDNTSNNYDGTFTATLPTWKTEDQCVSGKCIAFNNYDAGVSITNQNFASLDSFTMSAWINIKGTHRNYTGTIMSSGNWNNSHWAFGIEQYNASIKFNKPDGVNWVSKNYSFNTNQWYYVAVTRSGTTLTYYVDGQSIGTSTIGTGITISNATNTTIGRETYAGGYFGFNGWIDEPKIYNYARSATQIRQDYQSTKSGASVDAGANVTMGTNSQKWLSDNLVGYWKMDESSWTNDCSTASILDASGNNNVGKSCPASTGPTGGVSGKFGNGGSFDGSDDYLSITDANSLDLSNNLTISAWVKGNSAGGEGYSVVHKFSGGYSGYRFGTSGTSIQFMYGNASGGAEGFSGSGFSGSSWQHIAVTKNNKNIRIFLNGLLVNSQVAVNENIAANTTALEIGKNFWNASYFNGQIDEVRVYNRALADYEITKLYEWAPGPLAWWKMDDNTGTTANDSSGNNITGTLTNGPTWTVGKVGSAVKFDGSNDYVVATNIAALKTGITNFTIGTWVYFDSSPTKTQAIVRYGGGYSTGAPGYTLYFSQTLVPYLQFSSTDQVYYNNSITASTLSFGQWYYLTYVFNRNGNMNYYVNGSLVASVDISAGVNANIQQADNYYIGTTDSGNQYDLKGKLDDFKLYNYARTAKQIQDDMNAGSLNPIAYWTLDQTLKTNVANGSDAVPGFDNPVIPYVNGKFGKALDFSNLDSGNLIWVDNNTVRDSTKNWTTNQWAGYQLIIDYTGSQYCLDTINSNTATDLVYSMTCNSFVGSKGYRIKRLAYASGAINNQPTDQISASLWFKTSSNQAARIARMSNEAFGLSLTTGQVKTFINGYANEIVYSTAYYDSNWHHLLVTWDGATQSLYYDGILRTSAALTGTLPATNKTLIIGAHNDGMNEHFNGQIDEVKVYPYALTPEQAKLDYNQGLAINMGRGVEAGDTGNATLAWWKLDDGSGTSALDASGNNSTGTLTNGPTWTVGKIGGAVNFDGTNDFINIGNTLGTLTEGTVSLWFKRHSSQPTYQMLFTDNGSQFELCYSTNTLQFYVNNTAVSTASANNTNWNHVEGTFSQTGNFQRLYLNGYLIASSTYPGDATADTRYLGSRNGSFPFDGVIDDVKVYNYARTTAQVVYDYSRGKPIGYWAMDEGVGTLTKDFSGNSNSGTLTNATWTTSGKYGNAVSFDGAGDCVNIGDPSSGVLDFGTDDFSTGGWVYLNSTPGGYVGIFNKGGSGAVGYGINIGSNSKLYIMIQATGGSNQAFTSNATLSTGAWYHVMATYDRDDVIKIYVNGKLDNSSSYATGNTGSVSTGSSLILGAYSDCGQYFINGKIDDVRIYNYALTAEQVKQAMNQGVSIHY